MDQLEVLEDTPLLTQSPASLAPLGHVEDVPMPAPAGFVQHRIRMRYMLPVCSAHEPQHAVANSLRRELMKSRLIAGEHMLAFSELRVLDSAGVIVHQPPHHKPYIHILAHVRLLTWRPEVGAYVPVLVTRIGFAKIFGTVFGCIAVEVEEAAISDRYAHDAETECYVSTHTCSKIISRGAVIAVKIEAITSSFKDVLKLRGSMLDDKTGLCYATAPDGWMSSNSEHEEEG
eukprot:TRINITY_DN2188_c0_g1_i1.p1 TRINITY_DN2188_c0_g1~~TRINITY_DN2188_c0_g1_i1.p1  ORF type:complete len:231 (+),score=43.65 TRINITY_DN2188_c0_g1_i1:244-936(+)